MIALRAVWCGQESPAHAEEQMWEIWFVSHPWLPHTPQPVPPSVSQGGLVLDPDLAVPSSVEVLEI